LKPDGKCVATFFLLNEESTKAVADGVLFRYPLEGCWTTNPQIPESVVAYKETTMAKMLEKNDLKLESSHYGNWCGRANYLSYQDLLVLAKR
jgi:hypothetical protein